MSGAYKLSDNGDESTTVTYELTVALSMPVPAMMRQKAELSLVGLGQLEHTTFGLEHLVRLHPR